MTRTLHFLAFTLAFYLAIHLVKGWPMVILCAVLFLSDFLSFCDGAIRGKGRQERTER